MSKRKQILCFIDICQVKFGFLKKKKEANANRNAFAS